MFMHVDDDTGKTIGQYGQATIQERQAPFHTTCTAQICKNHAKRNASVKQPCTSTMTIYMDNKQRKQAAVSRDDFFALQIRTDYQVCQNGLGCRAKNNFIVKKRDQGTAIGSSNKQQFHTTIVSP